MVIVIFFAVTHIFYYLFIFYTSSLITAHHIASSTVGIRDYADFYYPCPAPLYCYDDKEKIILIRKNSAQTVRELVIGASFSSKDKTGLLKRHFIFGNAIDTKYFLLLPFCP